MVNRLKLQDIFENILGNEHVYYQPPPSKKIEYPAIIYERSKIQKVNADDAMYGNTVRYSVTLIDHSPDSVYIKDILALPMCSHDRHFTSDNLNHDTFDLYFKEVN